MKKFWGLLKREYLLNRANSYSMLVILLFSLVFIPIGVEYNSNYNVESIRAIIVLGSAIIIGGYAIIMTIISINKDVKIKDLWLTNSQSIYRLVGVKAVYQLVVMFILSAVNFIALFFVDDIIKGTATQFLTLLVLYFYTILACFALFTIIGILCNSFLKQLSFWIGKLSYIVGVVVLFFLFRLLEYLPTLEFLQIGRVRISDLNDSLPTFNESYISFGGFIDFYIVEELFYIGIFAGIYVIGCKWLERVITR